PRVIWDPYWNRFVVVANGCTSCNTASNESVFELAVSETGDPTGDWHVNRFNPGAATGDFVDFPQMGMDMNSVIFTFNDFLLNGGLDARTFAFAKATLYNGFGGSSALYGGS